MRQDWIAIAYNEWPWPLAHGRYRHEVQAQRVLHVKRYWEIKNYAKQDFSCLTEEAAVVLASTTNGMSSGSARLMRNCRHICL